MKLFRWRRRDWEIRYLYLKFSKLSLSLVDKATTSRHTRWGVSLSSCLEMLYDLVTGWWWRAHWATNPLVGRPSRRRANQTWLVTLNSSCKKVKRTRHWSNMSGRPFCVLLLCAMRDSGRTISHSPLYRTSPLSMRNTTKWWFGSGLNNPNRSDTTDKS